MSIIKMAKRSKKATPIARPITSAFLLTLVTAYPIFYLLPLGKIGTVSVIHFAMLQCLRLFGYIPERKADRDKKNQKPPISF
jgi:hypothetical protein